MPEYTTINVGPRNYPRGSAQASTPALWLDTKKHPDARVFTTWESGTIRLLIQTDMNSMSNVRDTGIVGSYPNLELCSMAGTHYLFYIDEAKNVTYIKSEDDFQTWSSGVSLATNAETLFVHKDSQMAIIFLCWVNDQDDGYCKKLAPSGVAIPFSDGTTEKRMQGFKCKAVGLVVKNGVLCLKYLDDGSNIQQKFSHDSGESWTDTF
jgi:hypothetical protein